MSARPRRLLDVPSAARYLGLLTADDQPDTKALYRLIASGSIAHLRLRDAVHTRVAADGRRQRYRKPGRLYLLESDCDAWIDAHRVAAPSVSAAPRRPPTLVLPEAHDRRFS